MPCNHFSKHSDKQSEGIELMHLVTEASTKPLPISYDQIFKILLDPEFGRALDNSFKHALSVLDATMQKDSKLEHFVPNLIQLLTAENQAIRNNGLKVLDLLAKYRDNYSNEFRKEIAKEIQRLALPEDIKSSVEIKLALLM